VQSHELRRWFEEIGLGRECRVGAEMSIFAQALQMRSGNAIDDLCVGRRILEDASFKLKQLGDVACGGRVVPRIAKRCRGCIAHGAQLAVFGDQVVNEGDPGGSECATQRARLVGFHCVEKVHLRLGVPNSGEEYVEIYKSSVHGSLSRSAMCGDNITDLKRRPRPSIFSIGARNDSKAGSGRKLVLDLQGQIDCVPNLFSRRGRSQERSAIMRTSETWT